MNVRELIEELEQYDDDTEVRLMSQPSWPFEYGIEGVTERDAFQGDDDDEDDAADNSVFLLEGRQLCYGSKNAWSDR